MGSFLPVHTHKTGTRCVGSDYFTEMKDTGTRYEQKGHPNAPICRQEMAQTGLLRYRQQSTKVEGKGRSNAFFVCLRQKMDDMTRRLFNSFRNDVSL